MAEVEETPPAEPPPGDRATPRSRELEALHASALASSRGNDVRELLDVAVEAVHRGFDADHTSFLRLDRARGVLVGEAHRGFTERLSRAVAEIPVGQGLSGEVARTGRPQLARDYANDPRALKGVHPLRGAMVAPVALGDDLLGVIGVGSARRVYEDDDMAVLAAIGRQLAGALESAKLVAALDASLVRHRTLVETLPSVVYEATCDGRLLYLSQKIAELVGRDAADLLADPLQLEAVVHPEDREARRARLHELGQPGARRVIEYRLVHANGRDIAWVADHCVSRAPRPNECGPSAKAGSMIITGVLIDLRERKFIEAAAREQSRLASLGELAAGIAHEINNPLSGVLNYAQLAKKLLARSGDQRLVEPLDGIVAEAERILEVTRALVATARRPAKEETRPLDPRELVRSALTLLKQSLKEDSIRLEVHVAEGLPPLRARGHELQQVLENLLTNARHALNERFPRWNADKVLSIHVEALAPDGGDDAPRVRLEVRDKGIGIDPADLPRIFDAFFTRRKDGTGLGLAITKKIVVAHEGTIGVESSPAEGTTFTVDLPSWR